MVLPLNLAMNASEMNLSPLPERLAWMACTFSPYHDGITNIPASLPAGSMLILNDRTPCDTHSPDLVAAQTADALERLGCESLLLDFQRPDAARIHDIIDALLARCRCPVAVSEPYAVEHPCAVFLSPAPLHIPPETHLKPWQEREIWLEAALCQEICTITKDGAHFESIFPTDELEGGYFDDALCCNYTITLCEDSARFTLFDTHESLHKKLARAQALGVTRAVGLWQELNTNKSV